MKEPNYIRLFYFGIGGKNKNKIKIDLYSRKESYFFAIDS